jgi:hypothetical protein
MWLKEIGKSATLPRHCSAVDNHACILLSIKIHSESEIKCSQKVTTVLRPQQARTRGQLVVQDWLRTEGLKQENLPHLILHNFQLLLLLLLLPITAEDPLITTTTTTTDYHGRSAYYYYYCYYHYWDSLRLQSQELREVSFQEFIILYKEYQLPPAPPSLYRCY